MANKTVSNLNELTTVSNSDVLLVETSTETLKVTKENLLKEVNEQLNAKSNANHTHNEYVTENELDNKGLATETFVTNKIAEASLSGGSENDTYEASRGKVNLFIETPFDGGNQPYHPSVLKFDTAWNGYKYWMAYTPYPYGHEPAENPCIVASNDLMYWTEPKGLVNPLDTPSQASSLGITYWSDTELFYNEVTKKLECWYRGIKSNSGIWVRKTSSNGITWSEREILHSFSGTGTVSASVIREDGKYKIWIFSPNSYFETDDATNWGTPKTFKTDGVNYWHGQVKHTTKGYELFAHIDWPNNLAIDHLISTDGMNFTNKTKVISSNGDRNIPYGIDAKGIYRPCFIVENGRYYLFYCTGDNDIRKGITLSVSDNLDLTTLRGIDENHVQYMKKPTKKSKYGFEKMIFDNNDNALYYCVNPSTQKGVACTWTKIGIGNTNDGGSDGGDTEKPTTVTLNWNEIAISENMKVEEKGVVENSVYNLTDYVDISGYSELVFNKARWDIASLYDDNKDFVAHISLAKEQTTEFVYKLPVGVKYARFNIYKPWSDSYVVVLR